MVLLHKIFHSDRLGLREGMMTGIRLRAWVAVISFPVVSVVTVDIDAHLHVTTVNVHLSLSLGVHVLALKKQLTCLIIVIHDLLAAVNINDRHEEVFVALKQDQLLRVQMNKTM